MSDLFVALPPVTAKGCVLFAKNSDRPPSEVQEVIYCPPADHEPGSKVKVSMADDINRVSLVLLDFAFVSNFLWFYRLAQTGTRIWGGREILVSWAGRMKVSVDLCLFSGHSFALTLASCLLFPFFNRQCTEYSTRSCLPSIELDLKPTKVNLRNPDGWVELWWSIIFHPELHSNLGHMSARYLCPLSPTPLLRHCRSLINSVM